MEGTASFSPTDSGAFAVENAAPGPRRSGRERISTQRYKFVPQLTSSTAKSAMKRKRSSETNTSQSGLPQHASRTYTQVEATTNNNFKATRKCTTSDKTTQPDEVNAKPTTKPRLDGPSKDTGTLIDLTGNDDDETTLKSSKRSKRSRSGKSDEKRLKKYRTHAPQKYATVVHRATTQRMVVVDRRRINNDDCPHRIPNCPMEEVDLAGSTGNIYTVKITHVSECTCPDFRVNRNPQCKPILYVLLKVLKVPEPLHFQTAYLTSELEEIFDHAGPLPAETTHAENKDGRRKSIEGDCPICCEELSQEAEAIVWCQAACGNNVHKTCFDQWATTKGRGQVTCPYCRTQWQNVVDGSALKGMAKTGPKNRDGYVNVADQVGMSTRRDYSTYHEYWVRAQRRNGLLNVDDDYDYEDEDEEY